jgi:hypothetical protein
LRSAPEARKLFSKEKHGGGVGADGTAEVSEARRMLDICASVGARAIDLTVTNSAGDKEQFRRNVSLADLARSMPAILDDATRRRRNVIVRPHGPGVMFLQLDDLNAGKLTPLRPPMFLALETSPGNYQAWLALPGDHEKEFARRVRKGAGADLGASGATRIAGSLNFKEKYAPTIHWSRSARRSRAARRPPPSSTVWAWSHRRRNLRRSPLPYPPACIGRGTKRPSTARRSTAPATALTAAGPISGGVFWRPHGATASRKPPSG